MNLQRISLTNLAIFALTAGAVFGQTNWVKLAPATNPGARASHLMAFDSWHQHMVLFGGANSVGFLSDTWTWDGTNWTHQLPSTVPNTRENYCTAFDKLNKRVVMFGGYDSTGTIINSTWLWDGGNWSAASPTTSPSARINCTMTWDDNNQQIVLYGGSGSLNDTWVWDGSNWIQKSPVTAPTAAAGTSAIAYDSVRKEVVLATGVLVSGSVVIQTWGWNGTNWSQKNPAANITGSRNTATNVAFDDALQSVVVFGGGSRLNDTWTWDGSTWAQLSPATSPPATVSVPIVYDAARQQIVMYGGVSSGVIMSDTWVLNASTTQVQINVPSAIQFSFNGVNYTGTQTINIAPGTYTLAVTSPQSSAPGTQLAFQSWDDGGAASHSVTVGSTAVNITGTFQTQYSLTASSSPVAGGSISLASGYYNSGSVLNLTPTANANYNFSSWNGNCSGSTVPCQLTMDAPKSVTANFASTATNVTVMVPTGVSFTLNGVAYQTTATVPLAPGTYTLATTTPQAPATGTQALFNSWSDGGAISHSITVADTALSITGAFTIEYLFSTAVAPAGGGTVGPPAGYYIANSVIGAAANSNPGYTFSHWSGDCTGVLPGCQLIMTGPKTVTANFNQPAVAVTVTVPSGLSFTLNGVTYSTTTTVGLVPGNYTLSTTSPQVSGFNTQAAFVSWSDGGAISHVVNVAGPMTITGTFQTQYLLSTAASPASAGSISASGPGSGSYFNAGAIVTLTPVPNFGYQFTQWGGACTGTVASCLLSMDAPKSVTAYFGPLRDWVVAAQLNATPQLDNAAMAYDAARQQTVLFGYNQNNFKGETWVWNGASWTQKSTKTGPTALSSLEEDAAMAYDSGRNVVLFFGGRTGRETWAWDGTAWTQYSPATSPSARNAHNMAYDAARGRIVLFGGDVFFAGPRLNDTWEWNGATGNWVQRFPAVSPSFNGGMVYDSVRQQIVLHGASSGSRDPWVWDGTNWTAKTPVTVPGSFRSSGVMAFDSTSQDTVSIEQMTSSSTSCSTWAWTGSDWRQEHPRTELTYCASASAAAYDAARKETVVWSKFGTWVYIVPQVKLATQTAQFSGKRMLNLPVQNQGNIPVSRLTINSVSVNGVTTSTFPSGSTVTNIIVGSNASVTAQIPTNVGASGSAAFVIVDGTYDAGSDVNVPWSGFYVVTLP